MHAIMMSILTTATETHVQLAFEPGGRSDVEILDTGVRRDSALTS